MFNFFNTDNNGSPEHDHQAPDWLALLRDTRERLFVFLEKLEARMEELTEAAIPELHELKAQDEREFGTLFNGVRGQLDSVRDKARTTYEDKVEALYYQINSRIDIFHPYHAHLLDFRTACSDRFHDVFDSRYDHNMQKLAHTQFTDYEALYKQLMDEHERIKSQFRCHQCGHTIPLTKVYFTVSHLACPGCQTRNTFAPSTLASRLEEIGRGLAEQRTQHLLVKYEKEQQRERDIYLQAHALKLKISPLKSDEENQPYLQEVKQLERLRQESIELAPQYYRQYQRAMFDEWKKLVPDLAEQTENFYQGLQRRNF